MTPLAPQPLTAEAFAPFGRVVTAPTAPPTAADATFAYWSDLAHFAVDGETEVGLCTVVRQDAPAVAWMEKHDRSPEVLMPATGPFLLPMMDADGRVALFRVEPGEAVVIGDGVWHSACLPADGAAAATYFVVFRRGTPAEDVVKRAVEPVALAV